MEEFFTATMATRRPARESASKRVSQVSVGLSDLRMPWVSGGAPVNIDAKQTGVTEGITAYASTDVGAWHATGSKASAYERTRCAPIASAANTSAFVTVRRAANAATSLNGGATQSAGLGIPKRSHTVLVTDATSSMPRIISDSGGRSKGFRHSGRPRPSFRSALTHAHEACWAPLATKRGIYILLQPTNRLPCETSRPSLALGVEATACQPP